MNKEKNNELFNILFATTIGLGLFVAGITIILLNLDTKNFWEFLPYSIGLIVCSLPCFYSAIKTAILRKKPLKNEYGESNEKYIYSAHERKIIENGRHSSGRILDVYSKNRLSNDYANTGNAFNVYYLKFSFTNDEGVISNKEVCVSQERYYMLQHEENGIIPIYVLGDDAVFDIEGYDNMNLFHTSVK